MIATDPRLPATFWSKVAEDVSGCWLWTGALNSRGYGCYGVDGVSQLAHRVIYSTLAADIPDGLTIDHLCRRKCCVNPAHLEPVTVRENVARAWAQNRPTHCPRGHEYTPANSRLVRRANGGVNRMCRECENSVRRERRRTAREAMAS